MRSPCNPLLSTSRVCLDRHWPPHSSCFSVKTVKGGSSFWTVWVLHRSSWVCFSLSYITKRYHRTPATPSLLISRKEGATFDPTGISACSSWSQPFWVCLGSRSCSKSPCWQRISWHRWVTRKPWWMRATVQSMRRWAAGRWSPHWWSPLTIRQNQSACVCSQGKPRS